MDIETLIKETLKEDCPTYDITTALCATTSETATAELFAKESGCFYGSALISSFCEIMQPTLSFILHCKDGDSIQKGDRLLTLSGSTHSLLKIERSLLNFLQRLCGIASLTQAYVTTLNNDQIKVMDTRKTTPLLRDLEKAAVRAGGGHNHRFSLSDMVLIKENHLKALEKGDGLDHLGAKLRQFKQNAPDCLIEIEIETLNQLEELELNEADIIMFDNFLIEDIKKGVEICNNRGYKAEIEVSGMISLDTITHYRDLPIQRISVGKITHSVKALDLSLIIHD